LDRHLNPTLPGEPLALPILATKLHRPRVSPQAEPRTSLLERLMGQPLLPLTLISAPAGYGKTTLASMWLSSADYASAWVSLDESDNDLHTFTTYLVMAVRGAFPDLTLKTQRLLAAPIFPPPQVLARYLLNDLDQIETPFVLALDEFDLVSEQAIYDLLSELLHHPSRTLHLLLIGRRDPPLPIASLRAHGKVTEIRAGDLRFTPQETARLLGRLLNRKIDEVTAARWVNWAEGWVTGLLLAALSLRCRHEADDVIAAVPGPISYLQDYLATEVMAHLPPARRDWLALTSLLDRFCAPLCEVVRRSEVAGEPADLTGMQFIRWLQQDNLFLVPLDARDEWFRFHRLFQQLLQQWLQRHLAPGAITAAHRRASNWFAGEDLIEEAVRHALAAGELQTAVRLVEERRHRLMNAEQWQRLERCLKLLPEEEVAKSLQLVCTGTHIAVYRSRDAAIVSSLQRAEQLLSRLTPGTGEDDTVRSELGVVYAISDIIERRPIQGVSSARSSLQRLPQQALYLRALAIGTISAGLQMLGDLNGAVATVRDALAEHTWSEQLRAKMMHYLCHVFTHEGDLVNVLSSARTGLSLAEKLPVPETLSFCRYHLGIAHYLRDELAPAETVLEDLLEDRESSSPIYLVNGVFALALAYQASGRTAEATQVIDLLAELVQAPEDPHVRKFIRAFQVELALRQGRLAEARRLSSKVEFEGRLPIWFLFVPHLTPVKLLLAEGTPESLVNANIRLAVLEVEMRRLHRCNVLLEVLALQALVCDAQGDGPAAMEKLGEALELGISGEYIRTFVDLGPPMAALLRRSRRTGSAMPREAAHYGDRILEAFEPKPDRGQAAAAGSAPGPSSPPILLAGAPTVQVSTREELIESLTERELEVLVLLARRLTYREIAAQLFISAGTVSQHVVRIYGKLQVHNRRQAVARARALGQLTQR
jgi:LuxR family maltose regulon positive regulatory protein